MELDEASRAGTLLGEKTNNLHFIEKYRPAGLDDLIGQNDIVSTREHSVRFVTLAFRYHVLTNKNIFFCSIFMKIAQCNVWLVATFHISCFMVLLAQVRSEHSQQLAFLFSFFLVLLDWEEF